MYVYVSTSQLSMYLRHSAKVDDTLPESKSVESVMKASRYQYPVNRDSIYNRWLFRFTDHPWPRNDLSRNRSTNDCLVWVAIMVAVKVSSNIEHFKTIVSVFFVDIILNIYTVALVWPTWFLFDSQIVDIFFIKLLLLKVPFTRTSFNSIFNVVDSSIYKLNDKKLYRGRLNNNHDIVILVFFSNTFFVTVLVGRRDFTVVCCANNARFLFGGRFMIPTYLLLERDNKLLHRTESSDLPPAGSPFFRLVFK